MSSMSLRNRLVVATNMWRDGVRQPLPKLPPGDPNRQIEEFELALVDRLCEGAGPRTARDVADMTWSLVAERDDDDIVKQRVIACHNSLIERFGPSGGLDPGFRPRH